ncbi:MAG TPA: hypothetical protein VGM37_09225 [Armatimonadota bacterium]|jgi:hypothetical protein
MYELTIRARDFWMRKLWTALRGGYADKDEAKIAASLRVSDGFSRDFLYFTDQEGDSCSAILEMAETSYQIVIRPERTRKRPMHVSSGGTTV